jgi:hypothetical protein
MTKTITFLFSLFLMCTINAQTKIANSALFEAGSNTNWPYILVAATNDNPNSQLTQTLEINITSLPTQGANYRVYKTTGNGGDFFGGAQSLALGVNTLNVTAVDFNRAVKFQFSSGEVEFDTISLNDSNNTQDVGNSSLFDSGSNANWPHILVAATNGNPKSSLEQKLQINITSLPAEGANYRVYKTTSNGGDFFGNTQALTLGVNTITVSSVTFNRAVKFQFNSSAIEFDAISLNDSDDTKNVNTSSVFITGGNSNWPYVLVAATSSNTDSRNAQNLEINITSLPAQGVNYRIYKTTANGSDFFGNAQALKLGLNSITVNAVDFNRGVKFQLSSGLVEFDEISLNGTVLSLAKINADIFIIYPNPAKNKIHFSGFENLRSIKIYSIIGSLEKEFFNTTEIDISDLPIGVHLIKVDNNGMVFSKKIMKY